MSIKPEICSECGDTYTSLKKFYFIRPDTEEIYLRTICLYCQIKPNTMNNVADGQECKVCKRFFLFRSSGARHLKKTCSEKCKRILYDKHMKYRFGEVPSKRISSINNQMKKMNPEELYKLMMEDSVNLEKKIQ